MAETLGQQNFALQQQAISNRIDQRPHLPSYGAPSCVVCGEIDELTPPDLSVEMAGLLPNCDLRLLKTTGHLSTMEAPGACLLAMKSLIERVEQGA
jgi:pimeloyl-ACP methyl ester carboxylesterase